MDKFQQLLKKCKCSVSLTVNRHRDYYESAALCLERMASNECPPKIEEDIKKVMEETNTIVEIEFCPHTPIGSYSIYHYDVEKALDEALEILEE